MHRFIAIVMLTALPMQSAADAYFVDLNMFRQWPLVAQQTYVLGVLDQGLQAAYLYEPAFYQIVEKCVQNASTESLVNAVLDYVLNYKYDQPVTDLVGDGLQVHCEKNGYQWPE